MSPVCVRAISDPRVARQSKGSIALASRVLASSSRRDRATKTANFRDLKFLSILSIRPLALFLAHASLDASLARVAHLDVHLVRLLLARGGHVHWARA